MSHRMEACNADASSECSLFLRCVYGAVHGLLAEEEGGGGGLGGDRAPLTGTLEEGEGSL